MRTVFLLILVGFYPQSALAQTQDAVALADKLTTANQILPVLRDPTASQAQSSNDAQLVLVASTDGGVTGRARIGVFAEQRFLVDAVVSGPISNGSSELANLQGLGGGVSAQFRGQYMAFTKTAVEKSRVRAGVTGSTDGFVETVDTVLAGLGKTRYFESRAPGGTVTRAGTVQNRSLAPEDVRPFADAWRGVLADGTVQRSSAVLLSAAVELSHNTFKFADPTTLARSSVNHLGHTGTVAVGYFGSDTLADGKTVRPRFYASLSFVRGTTYQGQPPSQVCQPLASPGATKCSNVSLGGPDEENSKTVQGEARIWISQVALSGRISHDSDQARTTVEFPVYFLRSVKDVTSLPASIQNAALNGASHRCVDLSNLRQSVIVSLRSRRSVIVRAAEC